jgi:uncharacterized FlaG/YvyC family protein
MNVTSINNVTAAAHTPAENPPAHHLTDDQRTLIHAVKAVNASGILGEKNELTFIVDRGSQRVVARIVNKETRQLVQQIPAEYVVRMAEEAKKG